MNSQIHPQNTHNPVTIPGYRHIHDTKLIVRLEGYGNYTIIHLANTSKPLLVSQTLKYFELQLNDFIRVSKSFLINPLYIERIIRESPRTMSIKLTDGVSIPVARRRILELRERLSN